MTGEDFMSNVATPVSPNYCTRLIARTNNREVGTVYRQNYLKGHSGQLNHEKKTLNVVV